MNDTVSVVIPVYNRYSMLLQALESVLAQTVPPAEVVVVDDGSTDISAERAAAIAGLDRSVRYHQIAHCGKPGAVRNAGVALCGGDWIAFLDSDDLWYPQKLQMQLAGIAEGPATTAAPLVHTRERWIRDGREVSQAGQRHRRAGWVFADALKKCTIGPSTVLMRRDLYRALGGFRPDLEVAEDYEFWLRVTAFFPVTYIEVPLIEKRAGHGDQLSERYGQIERFRIEGLRRLVDGYFFLAPPTELIDAAGKSAAARDRHSHSGHQLHRLAAAELARKCRIYADGAAKRGRDSEADEYRVLAERYAVGD